jgi:hypothetical protein
VLDPNEDLIAVAACRQAAALPKHRVVSQPAVLEGNKVLAPPSVRRISCRPRMDDPEKPNPAFSLRDIRALRLLAISLGVVVALGCFVVRDDVGALLMIGLATVIMIAAPLAIYALRRYRTKK